jgi:hypothetical protein
MIVAIHQPNFFPWLGYFDKLSKADQFIILDDAQFSKTGGTWSNRVRCLVGGEAKWLTAPVDRASRSGRPYQAVRFDSAVDWREKIIRTIEQSYRKADRFEESMPLLSGLLEYADHNLVAYNLNAILEIAAILDVDRSKITRSSALNIQSTGTDRLIQLTKAVGGTVYLCGGGAGGYQQDELFADAGIELSYQEFQQVPYRQVGSPNAFVPGLSIIDCLLNIGAEGTRQMLSNPPGGGDE